MRGPTLPVGMRSCALMPAGESCRRRSHVDIAVKVRFCVGLVPTNDTVRCLVCGEYQDNFGGLTDLDIL